MTLGGRRAGGILLGVAAVAAATGALVAVLPADFTWGDHSVYYQRIVTVKRFGFDARAYSAWAFLGKPFLALAPGLRGYHLYLVALFAAQAGGLFLALRRLGAPALAAAALTAAHGASYPLRSVGLMSSPKVLWLLLFDVLVLVFASLGRERRVARLATVLTLSGALFLLHRFGAILVPCVLLSLAVRYPRSRAVRVAGALAGAGLLALVAVFLSERSSGSSLSSFFLSHLAIEVPRDPARTASQIAAALFAGGVAGALAYLPGLMALRGRGALVTLLGSFAAGTLAFAVLHPSGEKAMFALPALHCAVLLAGVLSGGVARRPALRAGAVLAVAAATILVLPPLVARHAGVARMKGPYHDYAGAFFGFSRARPGADYARDVLAALPRGAVLHGDWGVVPILRHVSRCAGEGAPGAKAGAHYFVASPWNRLPARWGSSTVAPLEDLRARGLEVGRLVE